MPTGYTEVLFNRDNVTFSEFAQRCARAFGHAYHQHEEDLDAPLREAPEDCAHYAQQVKEAQGDFDKLRAMSEEEVAAEYEADRQRTVGLVDNINAERVVKSKAVEVMLAATNTWSPPSDDHKPLKQFMLGQLEGELRRLAPMEPPSRRDPKVWHLDRMAFAAKRLASAREDYESSCQRAREANKWIAELKASLP